MRKAGKQEKVRKKQKSNDWVWLSFGATIAGVSVGGDT